MPLGYRCTAPARRAGAELLSSKRKGREVLPWAEVEEKSEKTGTSSRGSC